MLLETIFPGLAVHFLNCMVYFLFQKYASAIKILVFLMSYLNFNIYKLSLVIKMDNFWTYNGRKSNHIEMPVVYQVTTTHSMVKEV